MCYMMVLQPGAMPDPAHLANGTELNQHGYGWSVGLDEVYHCLRAEAAAGFIRARQERPDETAVFHARRATGGTPHTLGNCQPLVLDDGTILAHNGALFDVEGPRSDTHVFADEVLPRWDIDDWAQRKELSELLYPNKFVILRPGRPVVMLNDRAGIWLPDGSWHSNTDFTGVDHARPGVCAGCGVPSPEDMEKPAQQCWPCRRRYLVRKAKLDAAR